MCIGGAVSPVLLNDISQVRRGLPPWDVSLGFPTMLGCSFGALLPLISSTSSTDNLDVIALSCFMLFLSGHFFSVFFVDFLLPHGSSISVGLGVLLFWSSFLFGQHSVAELMPPWPVLFSVYWDHSLLHVCRTWKVLTSLRSMYVMTSPLYIQCILHMQLVPHQILPDITPILTALGVFSLLSLHRWFYLQITPWYLLRQSTDSAKSYNSVDYFDLSQS